MVSMQSEEKSPNQSVPTPQCVGREFVRQYYTLLAESPRYVHRFYGNESIFVHGTDTEEVVGQSAIQNKIRDMSFEECRTRIRALDAHETLGKGVVVQVVGEISVNGAQMRRFVQTFVLAPQSEKKYYVHNDIFRYEDELWDKITHENGAPADPDAEKPSNEQPPASTMINGETHFRDEIDKARSTMSQYNVPQAAAIQAPSTHLQSQGVPSSGFNATANSAGSMATAQSQAGDATGSSCSWSSAGVSMAHAPASAAAVTPAAPTVPSTTAPMTNPQALPQRPHHHQAPAPPNTQSSVEPPPEPSLTAVALDQPPAPQRPQSSEKPSPVPSEEREEAVDAGTTDKTWANMVKQNTGRGSSAAPTQQQPQPHQVHNQQQQQPVHATEGPGTSAPATLSPTSGSVPPSGNYTSSEFANRQHPPQHFPPSSRQPYQQNRPPRTHGPGQASQDVRQSGPPAAGGGGGGGHHGGYGYGGGKGPVATFPNEQQAYIKNIPFTANEDALKEFLESSGFGGIAEVMIRRKSNPQPWAYAFVAFDTIETAQKLINQKNMKFDQSEMTIDYKRPMDRTMGGGGNFTRPYSGNNPMAPGGGGANIRGGHSGGRGGVMIPRGGGMNRSVVTQGQGGFGGRQAMPSRTFQSTVRGGGVPQHSQQQ